MSNPNTPPGGPAAALSEPPERRARRRSRTTRRGDARRGAAPRGTTPGGPTRRLAALASVLTAVGVLAAPALVPSASSAGDLAFPYTNDFDTGAGGTLDGDAAIVDGRLRLTDSVRSQAGAWSTDDTFPSDLGLEIEFEYSMYNDLGLVGADGLLLFLADGAAPQGVGAYGAALGYACRSSSTEGGTLPCDLPGVPGGFAAVAFDRYGNFSQTINGSDRAGRRTRWSCADRATASAATGTSTGCVPRAASRRTRARRGGCGSPCSRAVTAVSR